jgi:NitT/TauT family transport system substrate-binding protein
MATKFTNGYKTYLVVLALIAVAFFAWLALRNRTQDVVDVNKTIKIGYPELRIALPVFVAQNKGFFEKNGIKVELSRYETAQPMMDDLVAKNIDVAGYCALPITFGAMGRSKTPLVFLTAMVEDNQHPISMLIVKKDSNIKSIKDLAGKRIGILPTRAYEVWLLKVLSENGVDTKSVIIQQTKPQEQADALNTGGVDALFTNDPPATAAITKANGLILSPDEAVVPKATGKSPFYFGSFNIRKDFADANPDIVKKIASALDEAILFIRQNPQEARSIMKEYLKNQAPLVDNYRDSFFKTTTETSNKDLLDMEKYYLDEKILSAPLNLSNAQYGGN